MRRPTRLVRAVAILAAGVRIARGRHPEPLADAGISPQLRAFTEEMPEERRSLLTFVRRAAAELPAGTHLLDAGAGNAPYRELFDHCRYVTADWENSPHDDASGADIQASLDALPIDGGSFDAVLSTQVLEHVGDPPRVLAEIHRVLRPGGRLYLTTPLAWELHEEPHDYFRYTEHGLRHLLTRAGFTVEEIAPRNGYFTTLAGLSRAGATALWDRGGGPEPERTVAHRLLLAIAAVLPAFDGLVAAGRFPLGYACVATRPAR